MINSNNYIEFAEKLYESCIITDAWIDGKERFLLDPVILSKSRYNKMKKAAEDIGFIYEEQCKLIWKRPEMLDYFNLTNYQKLLWLSSGGLWHGIARLDLFILADGTIKMCEMNSDTPSGEAETVLLNQIFEDKYPEYINPNKEFAERFVNMIDLFGNQLENIEAVIPVNTGIPEELSIRDSYIRRNDILEKTQLTIGIVYPTEMTEDLSMIKIYEKWLTDANYKVIIGAPFNLMKKGNHLTLFDNEIDILLRHYKTDWWTERESPWSDFEYTDSYPLDLEINAVLNAYANRTLNVINPFGSVLTQNKFSMSLFYDYFDLFSNKSQNIIRKYVPETRRLIDIDFRLINKDEWVLKSEYGCEGDSVLIGLNLSQQLWDESLEKLVPEHWIAQRFFNIKKYKKKYFPNYGVYLITGIASGIFTRLAEISTDFTSITAPTFIKN
ncbi:MAG: glutathionylspermidine synthase family protein [Candidatus Kapabacteria bacterium]|nr:glutathionylspermidine synthase family protein [Candidatus Kapabacteria bacterium]